MLIFFFLFKFREDFYSRIFNFAIFFTIAKNAKLSTNKVFCKMRFSGFFFLGINTCQLLKYCSNHSQPGNLLQHIDTIARQSSSDAKLGNTYSFLLIIISSYQLERLICSTVSRVERVWEVHLR